jgi:2-dehydro-3-deoxyglucarate aldolase
MGIPGQFTDPRFIEALEETRRIGAKLGKPGGLHVVEPNPQDLKQRVEQGFKFLAYSLDTRMLDTVCRAGLGAMRSSR